MFSGLVEQLGTVIRIETREPGRRFVIDAGRLAEDAQIGDSVAVNGCCLTVISQENHWLGFDAGPETLARTNLGECNAGSQVNLERSLKLGDRIGGHLVTGHVDALGTVAERNDEGEWSTFGFRVPSQLTRQMASKGSITVDGVSLTLVDVQAEQFSVALIPHTLQITTLGRRAVGDAVNIETDLLAKYVQQQLQPFTRQA